MFKKLSLKHNNLLQCSRAGHSVGSDLLRWALVYNITNSGTTSSLIVLNTFPLSLFHLSIYDK